jgi:hypothetical protein
MNTILTSLLIAAALTLSVVVAHETQRVNTESVKQHVASALHGDTSCVQLDARIYCAPATLHLPIKLASN